MNDEANPKYVADFKADWVERLRLALNDMGVKLQSGLTAEEISYAFWNAGHRRIHPAPRKVLQAREFICPSDRQTGLDLLAAKFERGEDVNAHVSNTRLNTASKFFHDKLLNDWGIQHFHLGVVATVRHDECLFAVVRDDAVYFLQILGHGNYTERDMLYRVHSNWPEVLAPFKQSFVSRLEREADLTDDEVACLRDKNANTMLRMPDGTVYLAPGGGMMSNGQSAWVTMTSMRFFARVQELQEALASSVDEILVAICAQGRTPSAPPTFHLTFDEANVAYAFEPCAKVQVKLGPLDPFDVG